MELFWLNQSRKESLGRVLAHVQGYVSFSLQFIQRGQYSILKANSKSRNKTSHSNWVAVEYEKS